MNTYTAGNSAPSQPDRSAELKQLADALTRLGHNATIITPAPYLTVHLHGATLPQVIYNTGGQFWWHAAQVIAPSGHPTHAAETIIWALRARSGRPSTEDTTSPLTTHGQPTPPATASGSEGYRAC